MSLNNGTSESAIEQLEGRINSLMSEVATLRAKTNLEAVQKKLDGFMDEVRLIHKGLLVTLQEMITGLNAEGVKRYEGAVRAVNENTSFVIKELSINVDKRLTEIMDKLNKFSMMV